MNAFSSAFQSNGMYPTTQAVPNNQQVVIPQITIPQPLTSYLPQTQSNVVLSDMPHRVKGIDGAKVFQTKPNSMYALFDEDDDVFYVKVTDKNNYPTSLKRYRFYEEDVPVEPDPPQYVTMEEFEKFKEEIMNAKQPVQSESRSSKPVNESVKKSAAE